MRRFVVQAIVLGSTLVLAGAAVAHAQSAKLWVARGSDGTLYLVTDHGRFTLLPVVISDDELNASVDLGTITGAQVAAAALPDATAAPTPTAAPVAPATPTATPFAPIMLSGSGGQSTRPFQLPVGNYTSKWLLTGNCFGRATLMTVDGSNRLQSQDLIPSGVYRTGGSGETQLYGVAAGMYFASVNSSGCDWKITIMPL